VRDAIAVLNAGSSSVKFALFLLRPKRDRMRRDPVLLLRGQIEKIGQSPELHVRGGRNLSFEGPPAAQVAERARDHAGALALLLDWFEEERARIRVVAAGHRVVHGGSRFSAPQPITDGLVADLTRLQPLAPQHLPHNLAAIRAMLARRPDLPQVACFDTAFHATQPPVATRLALPRRWHDEGVRRYGFHGLSYEYVTGALRRRYPGGVLPRRLVVAHLGNGASMCAIRNGESIATTMGFSTLDGLMMGTRCGALDPGVLLYLMREHSADADTLTDLLYNRSGLLGVSGLSGDMRTLLDSDRSEAAAAVDLYCYRITRELGSLAAALGGVDALVFTGGVGENAVPIRAKVCVDAAWLGVELDESANAAGGPRITLPSSPVTAWVVPTDEEVVIARHTREVLGT
jgi:acetate kinase